MIRTAAALRCLALTTAALVLPASASLADPACFVPYRDFEEAVPHMDLEACPGGVPSPEEGFCRLGLRGDTALLYVFRHIGGEPCLVRIDTLPFSDFIARFGPTYERP